MTTGYQIRDVSRRSGFTAATLRYYEEIGLLPEASRTAAGYRMYDDRTLARLAFIARAKQLGCSLDEIADLTLAWDGGQCGPIQDRLRALVADKLAGAQQQIVELMTLTADLQRSAADLERHRPDGPCDDSCGCITGDVEGSAVTHAIALTNKPTTAAGEVAIACTLQPGAMPGRLDGWQALLAHVDRRQPIDRGVRATFAPTVPLGDLIELVAAEQSCCRFFEFAITIDSRGLALEIRSPHEALPAVHALFGAALT